MTNEKTPLQIQIGKELKQHRQNRDLTMDEVTEITGIKKSAISRAENGRFNLSLQKLEQYAKAYNIEPVITFRKIKK